VLSHKHAYTRTHAHAQERRSAATGRSAGLTLAGRDAVRRENVKTSGSKILRLESVVTSQNE
jgi:hypothetical protein